MLDGYRHGVQRFELLAVVRTIERRMHIPRLRGAAIGGSSLPTGKGNPMRSARSSVLSSMRRLSLGNGDTDSDGGSGTI